MKAVLLWVQQNPQAVKAYLVAVIALVAKGILAITGKVADLGQWSGFVDQAIDLLVGGLTFWGLIAGSVHASRGPSLTSVDTVASVVAAIAPVQPEPASAIDTAKAAVAQITDPPPKTSRTF